LVDEGRDPAVPAAGRARQKDDARWRRYVDTGAFVANSDMMQWLGDLARQADDLARRS
jgi:hypothetical protein